VNVCHYIVQPAVGILLFLRYFDSVLTLTQLTGVGFFVCLFVCFLNYLTIIVHQNKLSVLRHLKNNIRIG